MLPRVSIYCYDFFFFFGYDVPNLFLHKLIKIPFLEYIIELIKLFIATVVICIVVTLYIYVTPDSAMRFFIVIILSSVLHLIMYYYL